MPFLLDKSQLVQPSFQLWDIGQLLLQVLFFFLQSQPLLRRADLHEHVTALAIKLQDVLVVL